MGQEEGGRGGQMDMRAVERRRNVYLCASAVGLLVLGLVYAWSIFATPIAAVYGWDKGALQTTFNIAMICFCASALASSYLCKALSTRATFALAAALVALGFVGTALFAGTSLAGIYLSYGVLCGAGCGMGYNLVIATTNSWFPDKIGFSSGVMMMGMGLGSLILGTAASALIDAAGVQVSFLVLAALSLAVVLGLAALLKPAPEEVARALAPAGDAEGGRAGQRDGSILAAPEFYVYMVWAVVTIAVGLTLIGGAKQGALLLGAADGAATLLVGLVSTMNGASRLVMGAIYDRAGLKAAIFTAGLVTFASGAAIAVAYATGLVGPYLVAAICMGFGYGSIPVIASGFARERFGAANYARNFAILNMAAAAGSFLSIGLVAFASPDGTSTNAVVWAALSVLSAVAMADACVFALMYKGCRKHPAKRAAK